MSSYFTLPSFAKAKKTQEELQKSNPQNPVLKDEDEKFLERQLSTDEATKGAEEIPVTKIADDGKEKPASQSEQDAASNAQDPVLIPETQPEDTSEAAAESKKDRKEKSFELPSQEEAEAATRSWNAQANVEDKSDATSEKRTWASYLPTSLQKGEASGKEDEQGQKQTWAMYASQYVPSSATTISSLPKIPSIPPISSWYKSKDKDATQEPVLKEDGTVDEAATKEKQEKEVSVLLDNLNMASINDTVFAVSSETHKIYERFALVLKDTINGGPTAYEDMEKLMKDAGPTLEKQFNSMPPFVQTLVKSLPAKLGTTLAPELLAAASQKPGHDMKVQMDAKDKSSEAPEEGEKKKKKIPGLKGLISQQGAVAAILRNTVQFITTRFPFLASATNVVMSLSVFSTLIVIKHCCVTYDTDVLTVLMFVFWYCHKRGREARLAKASESEKAAGDGADDDDDIVEVESSDEEEAASKSTEELLNRPHPASVPLPEPKEEEKKAV